MPKGISNVYDSGDWKYYAATPKVVSFTDAYGKYNVAYFYNGTLTVQRYSEALEKESEITLEPRLGMFGNIICDASGYYYVCWGAADSKAENATVLSLSKYDYSGEFISECTLTGYEASPSSPESYWGTLIPFDAGSCRIAESNGTIACNLARTMYSGHQSNVVFYVNIQKMFDKRNKLLYNIICK